MSNPDLLTQEEKNVYSFSAIVTVQIFPLPPFDKKHFIIFSGNITEIYLLIIYRLNYISYYKIQLNNIIGKETDRIIFLSNKSSRVFQEESTSNV